MKTRSKNTGVVRAVAFGALFAFSVHAHAEGLPSVMNWTTYGVGTSANSQAVAVGNMLREKENVTVRVLPGRNDVSRMTPLVTKRANVCMCGASLYIAQEGLGLFAGKDWGPQPARILMTSFSPAGFMMATQNDRDITSLDDLKGRRVSFVVGGDAQNSVTIAYLAAAQMTWDDVQTVEFGSYLASADGLISGQVDAIVALSVSPVMKKVEGTPGGLVWLPLPHDDDASWKRFLRLAPYFVKTKARIGAGIPKGETIDTAMYPYPVMATLADLLPEDQAYALVKSMVRNFDSYKDNAPGAKGWSVEAQKLSWVLPYQEGAIRYFVEAGVWNEAAQANNDAIIARQKVLLDAWAAYRSANIDLEDDAYEQGWLRAREAALTAAGLQDTHTVE